MPSPAALTRRSWQTRRRRDHSPRSCGSRVAATTCTGVGPAAARRGASSAIRRGRSAAGRVGDGAGEALPMHCCPGDDGAPGAALERNTCTTSVTQSRWGLGGAAPKFPAQVTGCGVPIPSRALRPVPVFKNHAVLAHARPRVEVESRRAIAGDRARPTPTIFRPRNPGPAPIDGGAPRSRRPGDQLRSHRLAVTTRHWFSKPRAWARRGPAIPRGSRCQEGARITRPRPDNRGRAAELAS